VSLTRALDEAGITVYQGSILDDLDLLDQADAVITDPPYGMRYATREGKGPPQNYVVVVRLRGRDFKRVPLHV